MIAINGANCVGGILAGMLLTLIAIATLIIDGIIWPWALVMGPMLILISFLFLHDLKKSQQGDHFLDSQLAIKPFVIETATFEVKLQKLAEKYPAFFKAKILKIITEAHRGLEMGKHFETSIFEEENAKDLILQIRMRKLDNGTTSLFLRGKAELIDLVSSNSGEL